MSDWLSDEEMDRIERFAKSPSYSRDPAMLQPEEQRDDEDADQ